VCVPMAKKKRKMMQAFFEGNMTDACTNQVHNGGGVCITHGTNNGETKRCSFSRDM